MRLVIIPALEGGTCAIFQTECCGFICDESANLSYLLKHTKTQGNVLFDLTLSLQGLINQRFRLWGLGLKKKKSYLFWKSLSSPVFSLACAYTVAVVSASSAAK